MSALVIPSPRFKVVVGTGGIGTGRIFLLNGNHTLGREESRSGHFKDARDYCKQHIILHYISTLLADGVGVYPVGCVGQDEYGSQLLKEMVQAGLKTDYVTVMADRATLFSFCFHYPDGTGGNLTTDNSASDAVDSAYVRRVEPLISRHGSAALVVAAPEVPLEARSELLMLGRAHGAFCAASFTSEEIGVAAALGMLELPDLIALNIDEARSVVERLPGPAPRGHVVEEAIQRLRGINPLVMVAITAGRSGSWCSVRDRLVHYPSIDVDVASTAGAGDAFFAGLLAGIAAGCILEDAQQLATLVAAVSVTSVHTIHPTLNREALCEMFDKVVTMKSSAIRDLITGV